MSLDVSLVVGPLGDTPCPHCGMVGTKELYSANITHNLNQMAEAAGLYHTLWRPDELFISPTGGMLLPALTRGLTILRADPVGFAQHNPANGWGTYETLVTFVQDYREACLRFPFAHVIVSR